MSVNENRKVISNIMLGIMISVLTGMVLIGAAAKLLISGSVGEGGTEWLILGTLFIASALGSAFPVFIRYDKEMTAALVLLGNLAIVFCGGLVMDGPFKSVLGKLIALVSGGLIACVICMKKPAKNKKRKKRYR